MRNIVFAFLLFFTFFFTQAQKEGTPMIGLGLGLEYGGIGGSLGYQIDDQLGAFAGLGSTFVSTGYNVGLRYLLPSKSQEQFFIEALYGYNAVIIVDTSFGGKIRETYYGPSFGGGVNLHNKGGNSFWHFALLIPIRSSEYRTQWDAIKNDPTLETFSLPFTFSIGINFKL